MVVVGEAVGGGLEMVVVEEAVEAERLAAGEVVAALSDAPTTHSTGKIII